jgi:MFS family permease
MTDTEVALQDDSPSQARDWRPLLGAFFLGWVFMYADRAVFSPVVTEIRADFGVSLAQIGLLSSAFFFAYAALQVPFGLLAERIGRKRLLVAGFALFGASTAASGLVGDFALLVALGVVTGIGQATYYPTQFSISAEAIPRRGRALGLAIINNGMAVGVAGGTIIAAVLAFDLQLGWRVSLISMGVLTLVVAALMAILVWEPRRAVAARGAPLAASLASPQIATYIAAFCSLFGFFVILVWLPYYLQTTRDLGATSSGFVAALAALPAIPSALLLARWSDRTGRRRLPVYGLFTAAAVSLVAIAAAPSTELLIVSLVAYGLTGKLVADPLLVAHLADITEPPAYSMTYGLFNFAGMSASVVAPTAAALIAEVTGSVAPAFVLAAGLLVVGVVVLWRFGRPRVATAVHAPPGLAGAG